MRKWLLSFLVALGTASAGDLQKLEQCSLSPTAWADGDSFEIVTAAGKRHTIRLYGADCFEWHVNDETDARRLRAQRRYFGMTGFGGSAEKSIATAKGLGEAAAKEVSAALTKPFTVHTAFASALGDGQHPRVYGFVTTAEGEDLAGRLVRLGLARAFGVGHDTPDGKSKRDYQDTLRDLELQAAKRGSGAWAKTDWEKLPAERKLERDENEELEQSTETKLSTGTRIDLNKAARDELMRLPGVGEVTALRIIEGRPYKSVDDLDRISGIGSKTLERIKPLLEVR